jgi:23S rRNA (uracil1939-C5)-methyltransferase
MEAKQHAAAAKARLSKGDRVEATVESLAHGGAGVARADGYVVFARGGLPGDRCMVEITLAKRRHAEGRVVEVLEPGPDRVPERAPHPGATWQCLTYEAQLREKRRQVTEALTRLGEFERPPVEPIIAADADHIWNYRNKVEYSFGTNADGGLALGYHQAGRWDVVEDVDDTVLASERANEIRRVVREWATGHGLKAFDRDTGAGFLRNLIVREGHHTGQTMVRLVTAEGSLHRGGFVKTLGELADSVWWTRSNDTGNALSRASDELLEGPPYIEEEILGRTFRISPDSFFQTNSDQTARLYETAIEFAGLTGGETLFDLYCGSGTIGICMARDAGKVYGIELVESAVVDAIENAALNGATNTRFIAGDMRKALPELIEQAGAPDVVVVDPPRAGLSTKTVRRVLEAQAKRIVYVSCNPTTLAPNLRQMCDAGYELKTVRPVDMFPHTPHIECVARLDLADPELLKKTIEQRRAEREARAQAAREKKQQLKPSPEA